MSSSCDYGSSHRKHSEYSKPQISSNNSLKYSLSRTLGGSSYSHIQVIQYWNGIIDWCAFNSLSIF